MNYINRPENKHRKKNLIKLRDFLVELYGDAERDPKFDMETFSSQGRGPVKTPIKSLEHFNECGTTACVLGHAPSVVPPKTPLHKTISWWDYSSEYFIPIYRSHLEFADWDWCFSPEWPNNIQDAIARLTVYIKDLYDPDRDSFDIECAVEYGFEKDLERMLEHIRGKENANNQW